MTLPQFIAWMAFAYFAGMLTLGVISVVILEIWIIAESVDEVCDYPEN